MARIMMAAMPFTGHVAPMLAVAEELTARGHHVRFYTGAAFRSRVEAVGAQHVPWTTASDFDENDLPATFPRMVGKKGLDQVFINIEDLFISTAPGQCADLLDEWHRDPWDLLVIEDSVGGGALAAEKTGCLWATVAILPLNLPSRYAPPSGLGLAPGRTLIGRARDALLRSTVPLMMRRMRAPLTRARAAAGLPPSDVSFAEATFSPHRILASGAPLLDFDRPDAPAQLTYVGQLSRRSTAAAPAGTAASSLPSWWADLDGREVVHVTQGTQNIDPGDLIRPAIEALADTDALVVVSTGVPGRDELPFAVPGNVRVAGFLPYAQLLPRTCVIVTNGGWGGVLASLAHGVPLVVAGGDLDKPETAARVAWAGAGVNLKTGTPTAAQVRDGVSRVRTERGFRDAAASLARQLDGLGGAPRAAELLEELL
ncbi:glycosyltransferase [Microbacterium sp. ASV49]|uniref:Glycosyltransferase n=1 Tax=Microbacterium candidum TaxID=3041922 RepID=A0ABT7MUP9_9MICO|nr:glycosyltransferase [Microbacterium sp. ASV49]MDL9978166.1 glycosyltransferase [Microbacterium sp. ASV49]